MNNKIKLCKTDENSQFDKKHDFRNILTSMMKLIHVKLIPADRECVSDQHNKIIYQDEKNKILCNTFLPYDIFAIKDHKYSNKYMILLELPTSHPMTLCIYGYFVFFSPSGNVHKTMYICALISDFDCRNVEPSKKNMFIYDDNFIFLYTHRDARVFYIQFIKYDTFTSDDHAKIICEPSLYISDITGNIDNNNNNNQYVVIKKGFNCYIVINMNFYETCTESNKFFNYITYETNDYNDVIIDTISQKPDKFEGYPLKCINCNNQTYETLIKIDANMLYSCGYSFCKNCLIRYSKYNRQWICCKPSYKQTYGGETKIDICGKKLQSDNVCDNKHIGYNIVFNMKDTYAPPYIEGCEAIITTNNDI